MEASVFAVGVAFEIMQAQQKIIANATPTANTEASIARNAPPHNTTSISDQTSAQHTSDISQNKDEGKLHKIQDPQEHCPKSKITDLRVNMFQKNQKEFDILHDKLLHDNGAIRIGLA